MTRKREKFKKTLLEYAAYFDCTCTCIAHISEMFAPYCTPIFTPQSNCFITCCNFSFQLIALKLLKLNEKVRAPKPKQLGKTQVQVNRNSPSEIIHNLLLSELTGLDIFGLKQCNS